MVTDNMTESVNNETQRTRRLSFVPTVETIAEDSLPDPTISALVISNPLIAPEAAPETQLAPEVPHSRPRRRSSISILNTIANATHSLLVTDARQRSVLVESSRPVPGNDAHDLHACFPNGRMLTVMITTWNTAEAKKLYELNYTPKALEASKLREEMHGDMADILLPNSVEYVADLIVINTQETAFSGKSIDWEILLQEVIGPTHVLFHSIHQGSLSLCIFLRRDLIWFCSKPEDHVVQFRMANAFRTKASVVVCFNIFGTSFMFINSHFLDGHSAEGRKHRRSNFIQTISDCPVPHEYYKRRKLYAHTDSSIKQQVEAMKSTQSAPPPELESAPPGFDATKGCDCVFWAGDLNFRVDLEHKQVLELIEHAKFADILAKDEFRVLQENKEEPFCDFKEAKIEFAPTYKFDMRADKDTYMHNRTPSYTDRILYRVKAGSSVECTKYQSVQTVKHSDHKPVFAHFRVKLKPGSSPGNSSYGKFNQDVYRYGCQQREKHHSLGVGVPETTQNSSSICVLQ